MGSGSEVAIKTRSSSSRRQVGYMDPAINKHASRCSHEQRGRVRRVAGQVRLPGRTRWAVVTPNSLEASTPFPGTMTAPPGEPSVPGMALYGIFLVFLAPLLPVLVSLTVHPLLDLRDARSARR